MRMWRTGRAASARPGVLRRSVAPAVAAFVALVALSACANGSGCSASCRTMWMPGVPAADTVSLSNCTRR